MVAPVINSGSSPKIKTVAATVKTELSRNVAESIWLKDLTP